MNYLLGYLIVGMLIAIMMVYTADRAVLQKATPRSFILAIVAAVLLWPFMAIWIIVGIFSPSKGT